MSSPKITPEDFKSFIDQIFTGDPAEARSFAESSISPNYIRFMAGGDETNFEGAVGKVAFFRANCHTWTSSLEFFAQDGNKIAARLVCSLGMGDELAKKMEMMLMAEVDEEGKYEAVWEQISPWAGE
ncbi:uncharacterized protein N7473_004815 [Penicillium subrubescens]|uniref:SnoaL-like domain-containing protein n=1 Tax=Penicillium subrubescens TaxID=1316194 RepID=A0A1Q5UF27_9EURO|nr:uncharacterized protein N7473_004815 [Penicillium subrubescens]KAJ5900745.1 hypothetical protein N7473_004815 [Penicillium subrubescens]OKP11077.1 hypothetical protein PENSUB_3513 [Penicillium subrubescens]